MFTFTLAFFAGHWYFSLHFQLLSTFHGKRKNEFGRKHSEQKPLTTTTTCVRCRVSNWSLCLLYSIPFIFCERKCISKSWRKLMNYKFPDFSLTLTIPKIFLDFLKNFLTFPWPSKIFVFPWLFPDHGNPVSLLQIGNVIEECIDTQQGLNDLYTPLPC